MKVLIYNGRIITDISIHSNWVLIEDGIIVQLGCTSLLPDADMLINAEGQWVLPGFIDLHIHGVLNADVMDGTLDALHTIAKYVIKHGVTSFLATTLTASHSQILLSLQSIRSVMADQKIETQKNSAQILGAHLEGPYLNPQQSGAQNRDYIRPANVSEFDEYLATGVIKIVSLAPEYATNKQLIDLCNQNQIITSIAHTNATYEEAIQAIEQGITHSTHTFNAMTGLHHRRPGVVGAIFDSPQLLCELICDNHHVHPTIQRLLWSLKNDTHISLITDSMRATGMPEGEYELGAYTVTVNNQKATLPDGTLAGSILSYDQGVRNFIANTATTLPDIWKATSLNAAKSLGISEHKGNLAIGNDADIVMLDEALQVKMTIIGGHIVYQD